ncbi:MAG: DUF1565 domain-containing protein [Chitinivibrionales bacterium]|nr:DUF1565 domain-containing protein [Chitinivibrionales bacterium]
MRQLFLLGIFGAVLALGIVAQAKVLIVPSAEYKKISLALIRSRAGDTVLVKPGTYREELVLEPGVVLVADEEEKVVLDGRGRGNVVTMARHAAVIGFKIRNGTYGIFSRNATARIEHCQVARNVRSGILCIGVLPKIVDNVIAFNGGSGIQCQGIRPHDISRISHNTIAYNSNHGISLSGASGVTIENNIIAFNERLGTKIDPESRDIIIFSNNYYGNHGGVYDLPSGNFSFDPLFVSPKKRRMNFRLSQNSLCRGKASDKMDMGVRFE